MNRVLSSVLCSSLLLLGTSSQARAAIIFEASPSFVQPDENLVFNGEGLITGPDTTVQGETNQTGTIFNLTGTVDLFTPAQGQARVEAYEDENDVTFDSLLVDALLDDVFFVEFEANVNAGTDGTAFITATDSLGMAYNFQFALDGGGENFFGLRTTDGSLINTVLITSNVDLQDVRQIRIGFGDNGGPPPDTVPEPASLALLGGALLAMGVATRRHRTGRK